MCASDSRLPDASGLPRAAAGASTASATTPAMTTPRAVPWGFNAAVPAVARIRIDTTRALYRPDQAQIHDPPHVSDFGRSGVSYHHRLRAGGRGPVRCLQALTSALARPDAVAESLTLTEVTIR